MLPHDTFAEFANEIVAEYPNQSKDLLNSFIGELNKKQETVERGCTTDSFEIASSLVLKYPDASVVKVGELWFIRDRCGTPMSSGHVPIYRHIIASGYIKLDHMLHQTLKPDTRVIAINTDSVKVQGEHASGIRSKDDVAIGEYGYENSTSTIIGKNEIVERPEYKFSGYPKVEMIEPDQIGESSCMILGQAGTGKSYLLTKMATKDDITMCYTNKACNNLRDKGVPNVFTFDMYFNEHLDNASYVKRLNKYKKIMVDELSMTPSRFFIILSQLGAEGSESEPHQILLFGDMNQCKPVESSGVWYDYSHSQLINALTNYKRVDLQYVEGKSRYDRRLYAALNNFLNTGVVKNFAPRIHVQTLAINICRSNATRHRVNQECFDHYSAGKTVYTVGGLKCYVGMPIIAYGKIERKSKDQTIFNSDRLFIKSITDNTLTFENGKYASGKELKQLQPGFCTTTYKWQGCTIDEQFNIWDGAQMSMNEMYTAISRSSKYEHVNIVDVRDKYTKDKPRFGPWSKAGAMMMPLKKIEYITGRIYKITKPECDQFYIGSTTRELSERLKEHIECPVNGLMAEFMKDASPVIELLEETFVPAGAQGHGHERALEEIENTYIVRYNPPLNIKNKKPERAKNIKVQRVEEKHITKFQINDVEKDGAFVINYTDNGKAQKKKFRYKSCGKDAAMAKAEEFRNSLIKKYYG